MSSLVKFLRLITEFSDDEFMQHTIWEALNERLPDEIEKVISKGFLPNTRNVFPLDRFIKAVKSSPTETGRVGLAFCDQNEQDVFIEELKALMVRNGFPNFKLVGTGSTFQGFSTSPLKFTKHRYMKICGETGSLDLDLQLFCPLLRDKCIDFPVLKHQFEFKSSDMTKPIPTFALTTFDNKSRGRFNAPYGIVPEIMQFEDQWSAKLKHSLSKYGVYFEQVAIALMTQDDIEIEDAPGSRVVLYDNL